MHSMYHGLGIKSSSHRYAILGLVALALLLAACSARPAAVARPPETAVPTAIPPTLTASPTASLTPSATPSPTASATATPEPTVTPTATPTAPPRPDAGWEQLPGPSLLLPALWNVNYGKDNIAVANGVLTAKAAKGDWFTYENPKTAIQVKAAFAVDLKLAGTGHYGVIFYGRRASGAEWWQGLRRFDIGFDGDKYPVVVYRDGASSTGQRWPLKRLDPEGITIIFSPTGASFSVLDSAGNTLLRAPAPVALSQPLCPDGLLWLGTNADGGIKGGSSLTISRLALRSAKGQIVWQKIPTESSAESASTLTVGQPPSPNEKREIVLKPGANPVSQLPDQIRGGASSDNQRQFVQYRLPGAPVGDGNAEEIVSQFIVGPFIRQAWVENDLIYISMLFQEKEMVGRFLVDPFANPVITTRDEQGYVYGKRPEDIPQGAKLAVYLKPGSLERFEQTPSDVVEILGIMY